SRLAADPANARYEVLYGYAFDIDQWVGMPYTLDFDSSVGLAPAPKVFKCDFDLSNETADISSCTMISSAYSAASTNFSAFLITRDNCANSVQDYAETATDCGGFCSACPTSTGGTGGTGGGGGGGGGGMGGPAILYVTPTVVGSSVQVYQGNELIVQHGGEEYHFRVVAVKTGLVQLKSLATYVMYDINLGDIKTLGLTSSTGQSVTVEMFVSDHFGLLTFKLVQRPGFSFDLLPPGSVSRASPTGQAAGGLPTQPVAPRPTAPPVTEPEPRTPQQIELPESPIDIWTILASIIFVIFLVGGVALYRVRLHRLEKPPTVTRTGLETQGLPETSSEVSRPDPNLRQLMEEQAKRTPPKPILVERPKTLSRQKELEVQKYVFHAFSSGFTDVQVRQALLDKGWPQDIVDWVLQQARAG
ncbi:MAG: hypothetical protein ABIA62_06995, partial [Candidatus Woesearchaeota archaeon]